MECQNQLKFMLTTRFDMSAICLLVIFINIGVHQCAANERELIQVLLSLKNQDVDSNNEDRVVKVDDETLFKILDSNLETIVRPLRVN